MPTSIRKTAAQDRARTWRRVGGRCTDTASEHLAGAPAGAGALRVPVRGPSALHRHAPMALSPGGDRLWLAKGRAVEAWQIDAGNTVVVARLLACVVLEGDVREITLAPDGTAYVLLRPAGGGAELHRLDCDRQSAVPVRCLPAVPMSIAATRTHLVMAMPATGWTPPQLLALRRKDGALDWTEALAGPAGGAGTHVQLRAGGGDAMFVIDARAGQVRRIDTARSAGACTPPRPVPPRPRPPRRPPHRMACNCCCEAPDVRTQHPRRPDCPGADGAPTSPGPDSHDTCIPGGDADGDGCFVTSVVGGLVTTRNICIPDDPPCIATLDWPASSVWRTPRAVVVSSRDGRHFAVLAKKSLHRVVEHSAGRGRYRVLAARDSDRLLLVDEGGAFTLLDTAALWPETDPVLAPPSSQALHLGRSALLEFDRSGVQTGPRNVLMIPLLEPGQSFTGTTAEYRSYYEFDHITETARAFYEETTRGQLTLQGFPWFGADTPTLYTGAPLQLPRPWRSYWGPAWDPGAISGSVAVPVGGLTLSFSGDEVLRVRAVPAPAASFSPQDFEIRFPAATHRVRIPNGMATLALGPSTVPARTVTIDGTDRNGAVFSISVDTGALAADVPIDLVPSALRTGTPQQALADVLEQMLASAAGAAGLFERPSVMWHNDGEEAGMLHVSLAFAAGGGSLQPTLTAVDLDGLLVELGAGSRPARFAIPGDESALQVYLSRIVADAWVHRFPELQGDVRDAYFDLEVRPPSAEVVDGQLTVRINLSTEHGRYPAVIEFEDQTGLDSIGMDDALSIVGADTGYSGGGGPKLQDDQALFNDIYTAMIDATIEQWGGDEEGAIDAFNLYFNSVDADGAPNVASGPMHSFVFTPVFPTILGGTGNPDVADLRGASKSLVMADAKAGTRAKAVLPLGSDRGKIAMFVQPAGIEDPDAAMASAATLTHELGHALLGLPDLYGSGGYRSQVQYIGGHCIMGSSSSLAHFCAYNQRIKGWLDDDAIVLVDRPPGDDPVDREVVLIQLEHWDDSLDAEAREALALASLPGMSAGTPVVAALFLRLGGDGRQFDIVELRGPGTQFSLGISPPRVLITNAIDPEDDTRYAQAEVEGAGTTVGVLERYRRKVHLLSSEMRAANDVFDFASDPEFPEVGLRVTLLELGTGSSGSTSFQLARVRVEWSRGPAIDVGFVDSTPGWRSPDIAIIKPEDIADDGSFTFPEDQDLSNNETYRVPPAGGDALLHKVAVRVHNFGDASALNVQLQLVLRRPGGAGDWPSSMEEFIGEAAVFSCVGECAAPLPAGANPAQAAFDWWVASDLDEHVCFRAQIGDRDVPRDDNGNALASDDTHESNNWAQQNVDIFTAAASSPPDPVDLIFQVMNGGSYVEEVRLAPRGLGPGTRMTVTPARLRIEPHARGLFRVRIELEEYLLDARCGKDIAFLLEAWRIDDHTETRWGAVKYVIKPRRRTETVLQGSVMSDRLHLFGYVSPDVGAQRILLHIQRPGLPSLWETLTLGPAASFDYELYEDMPSGQTVRATAYFDGTQQYARSVSKPLDLVWVMPG